MYLKVKIVEIWIFVYKFDLQILLHKIHLCKHCYNFYTSNFFCKTTPITKFYLPLFIFISTWLSTLYGIYLKLQISRFAVFGTTLPYNKGYLHLSHTLILLFTNYLTHIIYCSGITKLQNNRIGAADISVAFL